jgi:penicillin amidase
MARRIWWLIKLVLCVGLLLGGALAGGLVYLAHNSLPMLSGTVRHGALEAPVRVLRDDWGVPHIFAQNEPDAYFALGYVTAQERLFQMEVLRRLARGEMAEILGPPLAPVDALVRAFRLAPKAEEFYNAHDGDHPEVSAATEAFVAGINHRMENEPLPVEFALLAIPARPFTAVDCLTIAAILPITFAEGLRGDPMKSMLRERHPDLPIDLLFPGYSLEDPPVTVMETVEEARDFLRQSGGGSGLEAQCEPAPEEDALAALDRVFATLHALRPALGLGLGSNSWVLSGDRSASGKPILASDPHIAITNPGVWFEARLNYPGVDLYGYFLPLIPFALIGHNEERAWALTMLENDDVDIYRETFDPEDPAMVMHKGRWTAARVEESLVKVRFGRDVPCTVRTTPHGPVVTDLMRTLLGYEGPDLAMSWVWQHLEYTDLLAFYRIPHARGLDEFEQAVALITSPGLNISYADAEGNIAWWAAGRIVIRPPGLDPKIILDGASGKHDILGYVPFEMNPRLINPKSGVIVSSNNLPTVKPVGPVAQLEGYWQPSDRAARLEALLDSREKWDLDSLQAVQTDDFSEPGLRIARLIARELQDSPTPRDPAAEAALRHLAEWSGYHPVESVGASVYQMTKDMVLLHALRDELGEDLVEAYASLADAWQFFKHFAFEPDLPFWDNRDTPAVETRRDIFEAAFAEAIARLTETLGPDPDQWAWGRLHTIPYMHPLGLVPGLDRVFNLGPVPSPGGDNLVNNLDVAGLGDFRALGGPSTRRLIDFGDPANSLSVLPTGNSGHFLSPHYGDQVDLYTNNEYRPVRITPGQLAEHAKNELHFLPTPG